MLINLIVLGRCGAIGNSSSKRKRRTHAVTSISCCKKRGDKANQGQKLTAKEVKRLRKLDAVAYKLKQGEIDKNCQLKKSSVKTSAHKLMRQV